MFITRKKHEAIVAQMRASVAANTERYERALESKDDTIGRICGERDQLADRAAQLSNELERFRNGRARSNAALAAANASRSEAARGKGE